MKLAVILLSLACAAHAAAGADAERVLTAGQKAQKQGKAAEAIAAYETFLAAEPADERAAWILVQLGDLHAARKELKPALAAYGRVVAEHPAKMEARMARGRLAELGDGAIAAARERAEKAARDDDRQAALWEAAELQEAMRRPREGALLYREIKAGAAGAAWRGKAAARLQALVAERVAADAAGPPVPNEARWAEIADLAETAEAWEQAAEYRTKLADLAAQPEQKRTHLLAAARCHQIAGQPERAMARYRAAAAGAGPADAEEIARSAGMLLEGLRRWRDAAALYQELLPKPRPAWARLREGFCREQLGDDTEALAAYGDAAERPEAKTVAPDALLGISRVLERRRDYEGAKEPLNRILEAYAASPRATEAKGRLQMLAIRQQEWEETRKELERLADKYPTRERRGAE